MACFTVPLAEAVLVTAAKSLALRRNADDVVGEGRKLARVGMREKLCWLEKMLYGGSFLLAVEHIYHGELSFLPPFLTAMRTPEEIPAMLHEMATVGVGMAALTTAVWGAMAGVSALLSRRKGSPGGMQGGLA